MVSDFVLDVCGVGLKLSDKRVNFSGIWLDMNDPSNFVDGSTSGCALNALNTPPFSPIATYYSPVYARTVCMDSVHYNGRSHMRMHNVYGHLETVATYRYAGCIHRHARTHTRAAHYGICIQRSARTLSPAARHPARVRSAHIGWATRTVIGRV